MDRIRIGIDLLVSTVVLAAGCSNPPSFGEGQYAATATGSGSMTAPDATSGGSGAGSGSALNDGGTVTPDSGTVGDAGTNDAPIVYDAGVYDDAPTGSDGSVTDAGLPHVAKPVLVGGSIRTTAFQYAPYSDWTPADPERDVLPLGHPDLLLIDPVAFGYYHRANGATYNTKISYAEWLCGSGLDWEQDPNNDNLLRNCNFGDEMPSVLADRPPPLDPNALKKHNEQAKEELEASEVWKKIRADKEWKLDHMIEVKKTSKVDIQRGLTHTAEIKAGAGAEAMFVKAGFDASASYNVVTDTTRNTETQIEFRIYLYRKGTSLAPKEVKVLISDEHPASALFTVRDYELRATDVKAQLEAVAGARYGVFKAEISAKVASDFGDKTTVEGFTTVEHKWTAPEAVSSFEALDPCVADKIYFNGGMPTIALAGRFGTECMLEILSSLTDPNAKRVRYYGNQLTKGKECNISCRVKMYPAFPTTATSTTEQGLVRSYTNWFKPVQVETASKLWLDNAVTVGTGENALINDCKPDSVAGRASYKVLTDSLADYATRVPVLGDDKLQCTYYTTASARSLILQGQPETMRYPVFKDRSTWMKDEKRYPTGQPHMVTRKISRLELAHLTTELIAAGKFARTDDGTAPDLKLVCDYLWAKTKSNDPQKWADAGGFTMPVLDLLPKEESLTEKGPMKWDPGLIEGKLRAEYNESWGGMGSWKAAAAPFEECETVDAFGRVTKAQ